jgi:hypothetical protein
VIGPARSAFDAQHDVAIGARITDVDPTGAIKSPRFPRSDCTALASYAATARLIQYHSFVERRRDRKCRQAAGKLAWPQAAVGVCCEAGGSHEPTCSHPCESLRGVAALRKHQRLPCGDHSFPGWFARFDLLREVRRLPQTHDVLDVPRRLHRSLQFRMRRMRCRQGFHTVRPQCSEERANLTGGIGRPATAVAVGRWKVTFAVSGSTLLFAGLLSISGAGGAPKDSVVPGFAPLQKAVCPYQPGSLFSADITILVSDRDTLADTARVHLEGAIPSGGRQTSGQGAGALASRYIAPLAVKPVKLAKESLKRFTLTPQIIVENNGSPDCQLRIDTGISQRAWALDIKTDFTIETTVVIGDRRETVRSTMQVSCFDQDTPVRLGSGETVAVKAVVAGDLLWNPVMAQSTRVEEVIRGTQADEILYHVGYDDSAVWFTAHHPLVTEDGIREAALVVRGERVLGEDGSFHSVTLLEVKGGDPDRLVYNLRLAGPIDQTQAHLMAVGGMVVGDFVLQEAARLDGVQAR